MHFRVMVVSCRQRRARATFLLSPLGQPGKSAFFQPSACNPARANDVVNRSRIFQAQFAGHQLLKIEVLDHVIIGSGNFSSLCALGYFATLASKPTLFLFNQFA
jgi:hypothetical protein